MNYRFLTFNLFLIVVILIFLCFDTKKYRENFIDNNVLIYSNYLKDGDYKEVKFDLNVRPVLPEKITTIDDWRFKRYELDNTPTPTIQPIK